MKKLAILSLFLCFGIQSQSQVLITLLLGDKLNSSSYTASDVLTKIKTVDGSGSGLDADTVDGIQASSFLRSDADDTATGKIVFGSPISAGSNAKIQVGGFQRTGPIMLAVGTTSTSSFNTSNERWLLNNGTHLYASTSSSSYNNKIWTDGNDGSGSGLDADTVDGIQASSFLRSDASDTYTSGTLTFGSGTGLDMATNDAYANMRVIRNANSSNTGLFLGYANGGSADTFLYGGGSNSATVTVKSSGIDVSGPISITGDGSFVGSYGYSTLVLQDTAGYPGIDFRSGSNDWLQRMQAGGDMQWVFRSGGNHTERMELTTAGVLTVNGNTVWNDGNTGTVVDQTTDITSQDWNTYIDGTEASWARVANMTGSNRPPNYTYGTALSISMSGSNKFQLYASHTGSDGNGLYFRTGWNTDYKGWAKIYDSVAHPALSYVDAATGNYGTIKVDDDRGVTWAGYAIRDDWVFMSNGSGTCGIYNDTDNEWAIHITQNAGVAIRHNGTNRIETTTGGAAVTGALTATGDITAYFSDERLKDFDGKIDGALDKVSQLNGYYYRENDKAKELGFENDDRQVGVSAQEVEAVLPEVIKPAPVDPEYKTVQYEKLVPLLIEAIKELKEEVRQLKEDKA